MLGGKDRLGTRGLGGGERLWGCLTESKHCFQKKVNLSSAISVNGNSEGLEIGLVSSGKLKRAL